MNKKGTTKTVYKASGQNELKSCGLTHGFARDFRPRKNPRNISNIPAVFPAGAFASERRGQDRSWQVYLYQTPKDEWRAVGIAALILFALRCSPIPPYSADDSGADNPMFDGSSDDIEADVDSRYPDAGLRGDATDTLLPIDAASRDATDKAECLDNVVREGDSPCGTDGKGTLTQICIGGQWVDTDECAVHSSDNKRPRVDRINGDGSAQSIVDERNTLQGIDDRIEADNRFRAAWIVEGEYLDTVTSIDLVHQDSDFVFANLQFDEDRTATRGRLTLPKSIEPGSYTMVLAGETGETEVRLYVLQGEAGEKGDKGETGDVGEPSADRLACTTNECRLTETFNDLELSGQLITSPSDCPDGYQRATSELEPEGVILCRKPVGDPIGSRYDEIIKMGNYWVDRYENSIWDRSDCSGVKYADFPDDSPIEPTVPLPTVPLPSDFAVNGDWTRKVYNCSLRGELPSRWITTFQGAQSCLLAGKHVCRNEEWQAAAAGTYDVIDSDSNGTCLVKSSFSRASGNAGDTPGGANSCISMWGAEDMIGNVAEGTSSWCISGKQPIDIPDPMVVTPWPTDYRDDATYNLPGRVWDGDSTGYPEFFYVDGLPGVMVRGGFFFLQSQPIRTIEPGIYYLSISSAPSGWSPLVGGRCCLY